jgi:hypothetical protein
MADPAISEHRSWRAPPGSRRDHLMMYFFLAALAGPISDVAAGRTRSSWLAGTALAAFVACFVLLVELAHHPVGLRERVVEAGGQLTAAPEAGRWFRIAAVVPLGAPASHGEVPG